MKEHMEALKRRLEVAKVQAYAKGKAAAEWVKENPELAVTLFSTGVALVKGASNVYSKHQTKANLRKQEELQDLYIYDRSLGRYQRLRHPLSTTEAIEVERRRADGERLMSILVDMRLV